MITLLLMATTVATLDTATLYRACDQCYNEYTDTVAGYTCEELYEEYRQHITINRLVSWSHDPARDLPADLMQQIERIAHRAGQSVDRCLDSLLVEHAGWYPEY